MKKIPILTPILRLLKDRDSLVWIVGLIITVLLMFVPGLTPYKAELGAVLLVVMTLLGSLLNIIIAKEDAVLPVSFFDAEAGMTPIVTPLKQLLTSRKTIITLSTILVNILVAYIPAFEETRAEMMTLVVALVTFVTSSMFVGNRIERVAAARQLHNNF